MSVQSMQREPRQRRDAAAIVAGTGRGLLLAATLAALAGCAVPGMQMGLVTDGSTPADLAQRADIYSINPQLVTRLASEKRDAAAKDANLLAAPPGPEEYRYLVGPQDVLRITVWDHPELTNPSGTANELSGRVVNSDGYVNFPFVGRVLAAGKTVQQIRDELARGLGGVLRNPQIDVSVLQYRSQRVFVSGEVRTPGAVPITDVPVNVTDAIAQAGGYGPEADLSNVTIARGAKSMRVDLYALFYNGDLKRNIRLQAGDVVNVPERTGNKVFVMGEVLRPNSLLMPRGRLTLAEALGDSGGVNPLSANTGQVYVIRNGVRDGRERAQIYHLNASQPDALVLADRFELRARDVVFVDAVNVVRWARVVNNILPTADFLRQTLNDASKTFPR